MSAPAAGADDRLAGPTGLRFPGTSLSDAPVVPVGVTVGGEMEVPVDVDAVGWYRFGPSPGASSGATVLAGHVDDAVQGLGAFARLDELSPGDVVELDTVTGRRLRYQIIEVRSYTKQSLPVEAMFSRSGPARLHLITCGGPFDSAARSYRDNVVAVASQMSSPPPVSPTLR